MLSYAELNLPKGSKTRPLVYVNFIMTLDGKIRLPDQLKRSDQPKTQNIGSKTDRRLMDELRIQADLILHGAGTVRADHGFFLTNRIARTRLERGKPAYPRFATLSRSGRIPLQNRIFSMPQDQARPIVFIPQNTAKLSDSRLEKLNNRSELVGLPSREGDWLDLKKVIGSLADSGYYRILAEGGPILTWHLFQNNLVDRLFLTLSPKLFGGFDQKSISHGHVFDQIKKGRLISARSVADEIFLSYQF